METYIGNIQVIKLKEHKDGSATYTLEYDNKFKTSVKNCLGTKRITKKQITQFIKEALNNVIKN